MATTINSGYANSPKLTANIADHADVYGGRALVFDGVTDYLDCGSSSTLKTLGNSSFSFSAWINSNLDSTDDYIFSNSTGTDKGILGRVTSANKFRVLILTSGSVYDGAESSVLSSGWNHVASFWDGSTMRIYINGTEDTTRVNAGTLGDATSTNNFIIGKLLNGSSYFSGKMCDFKIFDTALTEAQVQELYLKPENTPSAVQDNLVAWYPMIEGNPESPQSIVYDHSEKGLGSELVTNGTFDSNLDNWSAYTSGRGTASWSNGRLRIDNTTGSGNYYSLQYQNFYAGKVYKISIDVFSIQGTETALRFSFRNNQVNILNASEYKSGDTYTAYLTPTADVEYFLIGGNNLGDIYELDNITVKEVQMGNHATTNFFGDMSDVLSSTQKTNMDAILESDDNNFDFSDTAGNQVTQSTLGSENFQNESFDTWDDADTINWWTHKDVNNNSGSGLISQVGSGETTGGSGTGSVNFFASEASNMSLTTPINTLNNNTLYKLVVDVSRFEAGQLRLSLATNETVNLTSADVVNNQIVYYFVSGGSSYHYLRLSGSGVCDFTLDSVSLKEITTTKFFPLFGSDEINGNTLQLTNAGTTKAHVALPFTTVVGKSYNAEIKLTTANMSGGLSVSDDLNENTLSTSSLSGSIITSNTFVATGTTSYVHIKNNQGNNNQYNLYDNLKVREVGISSSGFETAVNEPVVPQVPLMRYNQMATFDGIDDYAELNEEFIFSGEFTVSFWVKHNSSDTEYVLGKPANNFDYFFINPAYARWVINNNTLSSTADITVGVWHHVLGTRDSSDNFKWYLNGVISDLYNGSSYVTTGVTASGNFGIKSFGRSVSDYAQIEINDIAFYNKGFTQTEAQELFNDGVALDATTHSKKDNLLGYWRNDGVTTWKDKKTQQWMLLNGTDTQVDLTTVTPSVNTRTAIAWVYTDSSSLMSIFSGNTANLDNDLYFGKTRWFTGTTGWLEGTIDVRGAWAMVTYQFEQSGSDMIFKTYANDTLDINVTNNSNYTSGTIRRLGYKSVSQGRFFNGAIAQAGSVASALTQAQITEIFNLGREGNWLTTGHDWEFYYNGSNYATGTDGIEDSSTSTARDATITNGGISGSQDGDVQGSPDSITIREGLNSNRDGLGFPLTNPSSNVLRLNGINEYVSVPHTKSLVVSEQLTLECWAKLDRVTPSEDNSMISKYDEAGDTGREYLFQFPTDKRLIFRVSSAGSSATLKTLRADNAISDGNLWHHYAVTFASGTMKMYVDGSEVSASTSGATVTSIKQDGTANVVVGCISTSSTPRHFFNGLIDEAKVYNRALSADEINKNYKHQKGKHKND